jgi:hypothetical protein
MPADAVDDDGTDFLGQRREATLDVQDHAIVQRVALGRAVQAHDQHAALGFDLEHGRRYGDGLVHERD